MMAEKICLNLIIVALLIGIPIYLLGRIEYEWMKYREQHAGLLEDSRD